MPAGATDRRTIRTKKKLKDVLICLLQTRNLGDITIRELAEKADISRGTFYLHFTDIYSLYQAIEDDVVEGIATSANSDNPPGDEDEMERMISAILSYLSLHIDACEALLRTDSASFLAHVFERNRPAGQETWEMTFGSDEHAMAYAYIFISYGFAGILRHWMSYGRLETPRQIAGILNTLLRGYRIVQEGQKQSASGTEKNKGVQPSGIAP